MFASLHHNKRFFAIMVVCTIALILLWCFSYLATYPVELSASRGEAQLWFRADRNRVWFNNECIQLTWEVSGISTIFIYDEPTVGSGTYTACSFSEHAPTFDITFPDGQREFFFLEVAQMYRRLDHYFLLLAIAVCIWLGYAAARQSQMLDVPFILKNVGQVVGVGLLAILLWQRANTTFAFIDVVVPQATLRERVTSSRIVRPGLDIAALTPPNSVILVPLGVASPSSLHAIAYPRTFLYTGRTENYFATYYGDGSLMPFDAAHANVERLGLDAVADFENLYLLLNGTLSSRFIPEQGDLWIAETHPLPEDNLVLLRLKTAAPTADLHALIAQLQEDVVISANEEE